MGFHKKGFIIIIIIIVNCINFTNNINRYYITQSSLSQHCIIKNNTINININNIDYSSNSIITYFSIICTITNYTTNTTNTKKKYSKYKSSSWRSNKKW